MFHYCVTKTFEFDGTLSALSTESLQHSVEYVRSVCLRQTCKQCLTRHRLFTLTLKSTTHSELRFIKCTEIEICPGDFTSWAAGEITRANFYLRTFYEAQLTVYYGQISVTVISRILYCPQVVTTGNQRTLDVKHRLQVWFEMMERNSTFQGSNDFTILNMFHKEAWCIAGRHSGHNTHFYFLTSRSSTKIYLCRRTVMTTQGLFR